MAGILKPTFDLFSPKSHQYKKYQKSLFFQLQTVKMVKIRHEKSGTNVVKSFFLLCQIDTQKLHLNRKWTVANCTFIYKRTIATLCIIIA